MNPLPRLTDLTRAEFQAWAEKQGERPFRGDQIWRWIHGRGTLDPEAMTDLPPGVRAKLKESFVWQSPPLRWSIDEGSTTEKLFTQIEGADGVESVLIMEGDRTTACISSQLGCPVACRFCASGLLGLKRNLSSGEIVEQFHEIRRRAQSLGRRVSNIVVMGMGEPLLNYQAVVEALDVINHKEGGGIGARHLVISTVGLKKGIERLVQDKRQFTLAFSLHAPTDALRQELIPFPGALSIQELIDAAKLYLEVKGREVTFEYVLLDGVNAGPKEASELVRVLRGVRGTINLIPYNENPGLPFKRPSPESVDRFADQLRRGGLRVSVRKRKGHKILAACGQLRLQATHGGPDPAPSSRV